MIWSIYLITVSIFLVISFFTFKKIDIILKTIISTTISSVITLVIFLFGLNERTTITVKTDFTSAKYYPPKELETEFGKFEIIDSLVVNDTINGITLKITQKSLPHSGSILGVSVPDQREPIKFHMTDEVYRSWKTSLEK